MMLRSVMLGLVAMLLIAPAPAHAIIATDDVMLTDAEAIPAKEMAKLRGGFFDPNGLIYRFAVNVRTLVDGSLLFARSLVMENQGGNLQTTTNTTDLTPGGLPPGTTAALTNGGTGVVITNPDGTKTIFESATVNGLPSSIINNTANNLNAAQTVTVDLTLQNMQGFINDVNAAIHNSAISNLAQSVSQLAIGLNH